MCDEAVKRCVFKFDSIPDQYKIHKMCDRDISEDRFLIVYFPDKYKIQRIWDEAVDDCLAALKFIPCLKNLIMFLTLMMIYFFIVKILLKVHLLLMKDIFLLWILKKLYDHNNFDEDYSDTIMHVRLLAWSKKCKALKKR